MSSATKPLGMRTMSSSGYNHNSTNSNKQYASWKGQGIDRYPVGTTPSLVRPLTNNDAGNIFQTGFGLARPIKHYRKGRVITAYQTQQEIADTDPLLLYNTGRFAKSSKGTPLGNFMMVQDNPGSYCVKENSETENNDYDKCKGIPIVASYKPNSHYLSENPNANTCNKVLCSNQEKFAKRRVLYANTNLKKNYYSSTKQYLQNRCKTFQQKEFNFLSNQQQEQPNTYLANCLMNTLETEGMTPTNQSGCRLTVYKPNNHQYAQQGAVSSSTRMLKLNVSTISTNAASIQNYNNTGNNLITANQIYAGDTNNKMNLLKNKSATCHEPLPLNMSQSRLKQNKLFCRELKPYL